MAAPTQTSVLVRSPAVMLTELPFHADGRAHEKGSADVDGEGQKRVHIERPCPTEHEAPGGFFCFILWYSGLGWQ